MILDGKQERQTSGAELSGLLPVLCVAVGLSAGFETHLSLRHHQSAFVALHQW